MVSKWNQVRSMQVITYMNIKLNSKVHSNASFKHIKYMENFISAASIQAILAHMTFYLFHNYFTCCFEGRTSSTLSVWDWFGLEKLTANWQTRDWNPPNSFSFTIIKASLLNMHRSRVVFLSSQTDRSHAFIVYSALLWNQYEILAISIVLIQRVVGSVKLTTFISISFC